MFELTNEIFELNVVKVYDNNDKKTRNIYLSFNLTDMFGVRIEEDEKGLPDDYFMGREDIVNARKITEKFVRSMCGAMNMQIGDIDTYLYPFETAENTFNESMLIKSRHFDVLRMVDVKKEIKDMLSDEITLDQIKNDEASCNLIDMIANECSSNLGYLEYILNIINDCIVEFKKNGHDEEIEIAEVLDFAVSRYQDYRGLLKNREKRTHRAIESKSYFDSNLFEQ